MLKIRNIKYIRKILIELLKSKLNLISIKDNMTMTMIKTMIKMEIFRRYQYDIIYYIYCYTIYINVNIIISMNMYKI